MFTGLVEEIGTIQHVNRLDAGARLVIAASTIMPDMARGDSIAIDGCCLTAEEFTPDTFTVFASLETLRRTTLGQRIVGSKVNLERALTLSKRLGGHLVSGHVDAPGSFVSATKTGDAFEVWIGAPPEIISHCVEKGSVTVDGISLTVVDVRDDRFSLWIIPETWERTTLSLRKVGDAVNLESDLIAKYVFRFLENREGGSSSKDRRLADLLEGGSWGSR